MIKAARKGPRSKCFTGCWTCRARRVKCDENAPSCRRCQQLGVHCEGYGVRLHWQPWNPQEPPEQSESQDGDTPKSRGGTRRSLTWLGAPDMGPPRVSPSRLDASLREVDEWCPDGESSALESGCFSVFSATSSPSAASRRVRDACSTQASTFASATIDLEPDTDAPSISPNDLTTPQRIEEEEDAVVDPSSPEKSICSASGVEDAQAAGRPRRPSPAPSRYIDVLAMPARQRRLIHHWVTFTSRKIVLVDEPHNPCRTMMLPMALKGLTSRAEDSNADIAIFHALCASAAYNLYELGGRAAEEDRVLALDHEQQAVRHLRRDLARAGQHRDQSSAMAIMACITVEAVSGTTGRWRTHVSGGLGYLAQLQAQGVDESVLAAFRTHMVKMAILSGFSVPDGLKRFLEDAADDDALEFTFPYYGVSRSFLRALDRTNVLAAAAAAPAPSEEELDALELQLYLGFPSGLPQRAASGLRPELHRVVHHTAVAFYYAGLVFFQRRIRRASVAGVQELVELGVQELQAVESAGGGRLGCMMMWPALVLGAECEGRELQERMQSDSLKWFRAQQRVGFRNLVVLEDLITTVWKTRDTNPDSTVFPVDWWDLMAEQRFDIFRL